MSNQVATPLKIAADKAMKQVSARRAGASGSEEELDREMIAERNQKLKAHVDALVKMKEELANIGADIKGRYDLAADEGFDRKALKEIITLKTKERSQEHKQNVNQYCLALDMPVQYRLEATN
jgi:uncharacterized protein (UPF0335 family)